MGKGWETGFWIANAVGIILIFLNAIGWLDRIYRFIVNGVRSPQTITVIMILIFVAIIAWITASPKPKIEKSD